MYERDMRKLDPAISGTSICLEPAISGSIRHIPFSCLTEEKNEPTVMEKQEVNFMSFSGVCFAEGKILASTFKDVDDCEEAVLAFVDSPAESQAIRDSSSLRCLMITS